MVFGKQPKNPSVQVYICVTSFWFVSAVICTVPVVVSLNQSSGFLRCGGCGGCGVVQNHGNLTSELSAFLIWKVQSSIALNWEVEYTILGTPPCGL